MTASWNDIEQAVKNDTIESLDKETLEEYLKVVPPVFNNPGLIAQVHFARQRMQKRLDKIESNEKEHRESERVATVPEKKWYEKPFGIISIGVLIVILGYFATEIISSLKAWWIR